MDRSAINPVVARQRGAISLEQLAIVGISPGAVAHAVSSGRWSRLHPRVYATRAGAISNDTRMWAAVLYAGAGAFVSDHSAAALFGFGDSPTAVHVTIPRERYVRPQAGIVIHRRVTAPADSARSSAGFLVSHPLRTVFDLLDSAATEDAAISLVSRAVQVRRVDPTLLACQLSVRSRQRWKQSILDALQDIQDGSHSTLELRFVRLLRAHGLPVGQRQQPHGRTRVDMAYDGLIIELDGRLGHDSISDRHRDMDRDNAQVLAGRMVLRFGWLDITGRPCLVAAQVAAALKLPIRLCAAECEAGVT